MGGQRKGKASTGKVGKGKNLANNRVVQSIIAPILSILHEAVIQGRTIEDRSPLHDRSHGQVQHRDPPS
eukprot:768757-Hanusia_phi.AAC.3